jgi:hypothetical protein
MVFNRGLNCRACIILPLPVGALYWRYVVFMRVCVLCLPWVPAGGCVVVLRGAGGGCYLIKLVINRPRPVSRYGMLIPVLIVLQNDHSGII